MDPTTLASNLFVGLEPMLLIVGVVLAALLLVRGAIAPRFEARKLLNGSERKLYGMVRSNLPPGHLLMAQVSYGEMLRNRSRKRFLSVNAKRADMVVVDGSFAPVLVIEYQGRGHWGRTSRSRRDADRRDRVKRQALKEASIPLLEVPAEFDRMTVMEALAPLRHDPRQEAAE